jgi:hypothetical protein
VPPALGLVLLSALPLTLARLLDFESSYPNTFDEFAESTVAWTLAVVLPLVVAVVLLGLRERVPGGVSWGIGLVLGTGLVLTEASVHFASVFVDESDSYAPGPALGCLFLGWAVVVAAAVVGVRRSGLRARPSVHTDWRIVCALVVLACVLVAMAGVSEAGSPWVWLRNNVGLLLLGLAAFPLCLLRLRRDQVVAGLVAVPVLGFWLVYYFVDDYLHQNTGIEQSTRRTEIICVALAVAACYIAQVRAPRSAAAGA